MQPNELEKALLNYMVKDAGLRPVRATFNFEFIKVTERNMTGVGFFTEFEKTDELRIFENDVSFRWGKAGARLNDSRLETGYLIYVDNGCLTTIEGYTYGEDWPLEIKSFEIYDLEPGMELGGNSS